MRRLSTCVLVISALLLAGCGDDGVDIDAANEAAPRAERYVATGPVLRDLNRGGLDCEAGGEDRQSQPDAVLPTLEVFSLTQTCVAGDGGAELTVWVYPGAAGPPLPAVTQRWGGPDDARAHAASLTQGLEATGQSGLVLSGPNWVLASPDESSVVDAQEAIGGRLTGG